MIFLSGCFESESGYGHKAREIGSAILKKYGSECIVEFLGWGATPNTGLINTKYEWMLDYKKSFSFKERPDLHIHIGLVGDRELIGKKNILFTSGVEVDRIPVNWIQNLNNMNISEIVVPSTFVQKVFKGTAYTLTDTQQQIFLSHKVSVVPESYDENMLKPMTYEEEQYITDLIEPLKDYKWFMTSGQVIPPRNMTIGADRKNVSSLIVDFITTFKGKKDVALLLKTNPSDFSELSYFNLSNFYNQVIESTGISKEDRPKIILLKGHLSNKQLFYLLRHQNNIGNVSITHGEGFGRFLLEASLADNTLIVPKYGAHRDFVPNSICRFVDGKYDTIHQDSIMEGVLIKDSKWFYHDSTQLRKILYDVYKNPVKKSNKSEIESLANTHSISYISNQICEIVDKHYSKEVKIDSSIFTQTELQNIKQLEL